MSLTIQEDFSPERSDQTSGKTVPWGEYHSLKIGDGEGASIDTTDLIVGIPASVASTNSAVSTLKTEMDAVQNEAAGARVLQVSGVSLSIVIWNETQIAKNLFPPDTVFISEKTLISDADGTLGAYMGDIDAATIRVRTITATPIVVDDPSLLYNVATHADLPTTQTASDTLAGRTSGVGDYSGVQNDETMSGQSIRWFITAIDESGNITWGMPFIINSSQYQTQSTTGDAGKVLTGGPTAGTFGTSLSVDTTPTASSNNLVSSGAVSTAISNVSASGLKLGSSNPLVDGTASAGTATVASREDHVHPTDTTRISVNDFNTKIADYAPLSSPAFTNTPTAPTPPANASGQEIMTAAGLRTALTGNLGSIAPPMDGTGAAGTATTVARSDHVHPTDTTRASIDELNSATFVRRTGTLTTSWSGSATNGWTQTVSIANKVTGIVGPPSTLTNAQYDAYVAAGVRVSARTDTSLTFTARNEKPAIQLPFEYIGVQ